MTTFSENDSRQAWVPVSQRVPNNGTWVLHTHAGIRAPEYGPFRDGQFWVGDKSVLTTHWLPVPFIDESKTQMLYYRPMNAQEARKITDAASETTDIQPILNYVYAQIKDAAKKKQCSIRDPLSERVPVEWSRSEVKEAVYRALRAEKYTVTRHPDADPGHPCSRPYTTISW